MNDLQILKSKDRIASKVYTRYLSEECFCLICRRTPCDPCHTIPRGRAHGSDLRCLPLCRFCHNAFDAAGEQKEAWLLVRINEAGRFYGKTVDDIIISVQLEFRRSRRLSLEAEFEDVMRVAGFLNAPYTKRKNRK
jgi:hypothetical protein